MNKLIPLEFKEQRIITTKLLAEQFGTEEGNIQKNYGRNEKRFIDGKHYYKLEGQALKEFKNSLPTESLEPIKFAPVLYLWTEKGVARHAKILDTDEAWEVYEQLEETYFRVKEIGQALNTSQLSPELQMFKQIFDSVAKQQLEQKKLKAEVEETKEEINDIREIVSLNSTDWRKDTSALINKIALRLGGFEYINKVRNESYERLEKRIPIKLETRLTNKRRRMADEGVCKSRRDKLNYLDVIADDKKALEVYLAIIKEMAISNGVGI